MRREFLPVIRAGSLLSLGRDREDCAVVCLQQLDSPRQIAGVPELASDPKVGTEERAGEFGHQFLGRIVGLRRLEGSEGRHCDVGELGPERRLPPPTGTRGPCQFDPGRGTFALLGEAGNTDVGCFAGYGAGGIARMALTTQYGWRALGNWRWPAAGACLLLIVFLLAPGPTFFWNFWGFRSLFHDSFGWGSSWAAVVALPIAFVYVIALPIALRWLLLGRKPLRALIAVMLIYGSTPLLHGLLDANFNQQSGKAQKYYIVKPNGDIATSDSEGFDGDLGIPKRLLTPDVARIIRRQELGLHARPVTGDVRTLAFFDTITGKPRVWYSRRPDGGYDLFDAEGFAPGSGVLLQSVSQNVVEAIQAYAAAEQERARADEKKRALEAQAKAKEADERSKIAAREEMIRQLVVLFVPTGYTPGAVIVGVKPEQPTDQSSREAVQEVMLQLSANLRARGFSANALAERVYGSPYFDSIMSGDYGPLYDTGLAKRMRAAIFTLVSAQCQAATSISGVMSCTVNSRFRVIGHNGADVYTLQLEEIGASSSWQDAIRQATQQLFLRHPEFFDALGKSEALPPQP